MNEQQLLETVENVLTNEFRVPDDEYGHDTGFEAMGLDSLDLVELTLVVEDETGVAIGDDELEDVRTPRDAVTVVLERRPGDTASPSRPDDKQSVEA